MKSDYYRYVVLVVAMPVPEIMEEIVEITQLVPQQRILERIVEMTDVPIPSVREEIVEVADHWPQERVQNHTEEHIVDVPVTHRRVFIADGCDEVIPEWLNSVKNVADSEELPLNVYRETLQQNKILRVIKKNHADRCLDMFAEIAEQKDDYKMFYAQFVKCMKLEIKKSFIDGAEIAELLRFNTCGDEQISFKEYVDCMKEGQNDIYYITDESIAVVSSSFFCENLRKKGYEVLYVADLVEEFAAQQLEEFDGMNGKMPKPTTKEGLVFGDQDEKKKHQELKAEFEPLMKG